MTPRHLPFSAVCLKCARPPADDGMDAGAGAGQQNRATELRYVARQAILDASGRVHAYDLNFRNAPEVIFRRDPEVAMETMLDNEVLFGLERLSNGQSAFIGCTGEALADERVLVLAP